MDREIRDLIRQMSSANPLWGAPRIHGELLKLGIEVSQGTVAKYMERRRERHLLRTGGVPSQNLNPLWLLKTWSARTETPRVARAARRLS
jgi:hypothetical protein